MKHVTKRQIWIDAAWEPILVAFGVIVFIAILTWGCTSQKETQGHLRNAEIGEKQRVELGACLESAKQSDAGSREYQVYEDCANRVDMKYGKK